MAQFWDVSDVWEGDQGIVEVRYSFTRALDAKVMAVSFLDADPQAADLFDEVR